MINQTLKTIGLTDGEIKIYFALLELGSSTTWNITKKSKISGSKVYEVLNRLIDKGLVNLTIKNNVKYFEAASPERILNYLDEKKQQIDYEKKDIIKIIPQLILKQKQAPKSEVKIYTGWEGLKTVEDDILNSLKRGEEWLSMGLTEQPESWEVYFNKKHEERAKKGIVHKHLLNEKYISLYKKRKHLAHTEFRFLPKEMEMPTSTEIYTNKVLIFILEPTNPLAILIESKPVFDSFKKYFEVLWKIAKR
ncbi:MAG TPA: helix-turn-helix domain-containing protein [Candidatus Paceibacterota bacterium]|nr:helix-turn-helix domain-containing protein [Candidatus Paceibacterota bacterium]